MPPKYKLIKADDGPNVKPICAFFTLPQGCRNEAKCQFLHQDPEPEPVEPPPPSPELQKEKKNKKAKTSPAVVAPPAAGGAAEGTNTRRKRQRIEQQQSTSAVEATSESSRKKAKKAKEPVYEEEEEDESSSEEEAPIVAPKSTTKRGPATAVAAKKGALSRANGAPAAAATNPFLVAQKAPTPAAAQHPPAPAAASKGGITFKGLPNFQAPSLPTQNGHITAAAAPPIKGRKQAVVVASTTTTTRTKAIGAVGKKGASTTTTIAATTAPSTIGLAAKLSFLPISPFSLRRPAEEEADEEEQDVEEDGEEEEKEEEESIKPTRLTDNKKAKAAAAAAIVETHGGTKWIPCVEATASHPRYATNFKLADVDGDWVKPKKHGKWCKDLPHVIAMDCEMCATRDPVSKKQNGKALIRLSVINGHDDQDVLIDTLVLPSLPVVDYRTDIHGIKANNLQKVMFTFRHAQAAMLQLCCEETVIIGHGLNNDLASLKLSHKRVVDTSMLFQREDAPSHTPALKDLADALLGTSMPEPHDSVADARATLLVAKHFLEQGPAAPVPRLPSSKKRRQEAFHTNLLLHRMPSFVKAEHVTEMFQSRTHVTPVSVDPVLLTETGATALGKTTARFLSKAHADLAFETLTGPARPDKDGRPQKRVYLANNKGYVQVRLMYTPGDEVDGEEAAGQEEENGVKGDGVDPFGKVF